MHKERILGTHVADYMNYLNEVRGMFWSVDGVCVVGGGYVNNMDGDARLLTCVAATSMDGTDRTLTDIQMTTLFSGAQEDQEFYEKAFSKYIEEGVSGDDYEELLEKV